jgi:SulP family sulfate permease
VRILLPLDEKQSHHLATFGRGDFIGEMAFLDGAARSANAVAFSDTDIYALSRRRFDVLAREHKRLAIDLFEGLARMLAIRMRFTNAELRLLQLA